MPAFLDTQRGLKKCSCWVCVDIGWAVSTGRQSEEGPPCHLSSSHDLLILQCKGYAYLALDV